jgi:hypothetical protein
LAFTRNPFLLAVMIARYNIRRRRNTRDFELFSVSCLAEARRVRLIQA